MKEYEVTATIKTRIKAEDAGDASRIFFEMLKQGEYSDKDISGIESIQVTSK